MLERYADLLVSYALNVQKDQIVNIATEVIHREFAYLIAEHAYRKGAKFVQIDLIEPRLAKTRVLNSSEENLSYVPSFLDIKYREMVHSTAANLRLIGSEEPDLLADLPAKALNTIRVSQRKALSYYYDEGIGKSMVHWTVAAAATEKWGQKLFPEDSPKIAKKKLWNEIFNICRLNNKNYLELWHKHNAQLKDRAKRLNELKIEKLHFVGPLTDLEVFLSPKSIFKGGSDISPRHVHFEPNIPTEEVFTTPDYRKTKGFVKTTRPFLINGKLIKNLQLNFKKGEIVDFTADEGRETFAEYINSDLGARRLGEVALVGIDSPIFKSNLVFEEILFDENAACHIAVGAAYKFCLEGGESMTQEKLVQIGCNESTAHTDMMISSEEVDVIAKTYEGETVPIILKGQWAKQFLF